MHSIVLYRIVLYCIVLYISIYKQVHVAVGYHKVKHNIA